jgi:hypothetical protein
MTKETTTNRESRERETGLKPNWTPSDMRGVRTDTGRGVSEGKRFPQYRKIWEWIDSSAKAFGARKSK